jgi:hypothetical protein
MHRSLLYFREYWISMLMWRDGWSNKHALLKLNYLTCIAKLSTQNEPSTKWIIFNLIWRDVYCICFLHSTLVVYHISMLDWSTKLDRVDENDLLIVFYIFITNWLQIKLQLDFNVSLKYAFLNFKKVHVRIVNVVTFLTQKELLLLFITFNKFIQSLTNL